MAHVFGDAVGLANDGGPLHERAEQAFGVDFLKRLAVLDARVGQADKENHGGGVLLGHVQAAHGVGEPRTARDKADAGLARELAPGLSHHGGATLLPADDGLDAIAVVQAIKRGQKALAGHGESTAGSLCLKLVDQDLAAVPHASAPRERNLDFRGPANRARPIGGSLSQPRPFRYRGRHSGRAWPLSTALHRFAAGSGACECVRTLARSPHRPGGARGWQLRWARGALRAAPRRSFNAPDRGWR